MSGYLADDTMEVGSGRRLALSEDSLLVEARGGGGRWMPARAIGYDEIRAVYSYDVRDWTFAGAAAGIWVGLLVLTLIGAAAANWPQPVIWGALGLITLVLGGAAAYRVGTVPRKLLRIDAYGGMLIVPNRGAGFFNSLSARLPKAPAAPPPPSHEAPAEPPAAPAPEPEYGYYLSPPSDGSSGSS